MEHFVFRDFQHSECLQDAWECLLLQLGGFGFDRAYYVRKQNLIEPLFTNISDLIVFSNYDSAIMDYFLHARAYRDNFAIRRLMNHEQVLSWGDTHQHYRQGHLSDKECAVYEQMVAFGVVAGYSCGFGRIRGWSSGAGLYIEGCEAQEEADAIWSAHGEDIISYLRVFDMLVSRLSFNHEAQLTSTQLQILALIADGKINAEIAQLRDIHPRTVETHLAEVRNRLGCQTTAQAIYMATIRGLI